MIKKVLLTVAMGAICNTLTPTEEGSRVVLYSWQHYTNQEQDFYQSCAADVYGQYHTVVLDGDEYYDLWSTDEGVFMCTSESDWESISEAPDGADVSGSIADICEYIADTVLHNNKSTVYVGDTYTYTYLYSEDLELLPELEYSEEPQSYIMKCIYGDDFVSVTLKVISDGQFELFKWSATQRPEEEMEIIAPYFLLN